MGCEWLNFKTEAGRDLCKQALKNNDYDNMIDYDELAKKKPVNINKKVGRPKKTEKCLLTREQKKCNDLRILNALDFPEEIKDNTEVLNQSELYKLTIEQIVNEYIQNHPEKIKQHPSKWKNDLFTKIKQSIPLPDTDNINLLYFLWDIHKAICYEIACTPSIEGFCIMTGLRYHRIKEWEKEYRLSPEHMRFLKNILADCEACLVDDIIQSPITRGGSMFVLKCRYNYSETAIVRHESVAIQQKSIDDIPVFDE